MSIYVKFDLDLHSEGHLLQELDGQTHCDCVGEKRDKNRLNGVGDIQRLFLLFEVTQFPAGK